MFVGSLSGCLLTDQENILDLTYVVQRCDKIVIHKDEVVTLECKDIMRKTYDENIFDNDIEDMK